MKRSRLSECLEKEIAPFLENESAEAWAVIVREAAAGGGGMKVITLSPKYDELLKRKKESGFKVTNFRCWMCFDTGTRQDVIGRTQPCDCEAGKKEDHENNR